MKMHLVLGVLAVGAFAACGTDEKDGDDGDAPPEFPVTQPSEPTPPPADPDLLLHCISLKGQSATFTFDLRRGASPEQPKGVLTTPATDAQPASQVEMTCDEVATRPADPSRRFWSCAEAPDYQGRYVSLSQSLSSGEGSGSLGAWIQGAGAGGGPRGSMLGAMTSG
jgi:hypothetical protein